MSTPPIAPADPPAVAPLTMQQFIELGRLPDFIRDVQPYDGKPTELLSWLTDIEGIFNMYRDAGATNAQIDLIERSVRRKIRGEAADVLNSNNVQHEWTDVKKTLILYYRDKRDLKTLDFELTSIKKSGNESLGSYYSRVNELLASIIAQIQTEEKFFLHIDSHIDFFREKAIDAFIRGLEKPLCQLLKTSNPKTLNQAYQFCLDYYNMDSRSAPYRNEHPIHIPKPRELDISKIPPRLPPRRLPPTPLPRSFQPFQSFQPVQPFQMSPFNRQNFQAFHENRPRHQFLTTPLNSQPPPRPWFPKPLPRPEPMEVDQSIRSRNINYGNRPSLDNKRPHPPSNHLHNYKRVAHPLEYPDDPCYADHEPEYDDYYEQYRLPEEQTQNYAHYYGEPSSQEIPEVEQESEPQPSTSQTNFLEWKPSW